jgi:hypothetical protein
MDPSILKALKTVWEARTKAEGKNPQRQKPAPRQYHTPLPAGKERTLLPEIWVLVVHYLVQPLPIPDGKRARWEIRQQDLTAMLRVSKVRNIAFRHRL